MAFPSGVTTATISLGTMFDFRGIAVEKVTAKVEVFLGGNATKLNYRGTGQTVVPSVFTVDAVEGMVSFQLPHVDQPGFFAGDGSEAKYWAYIISIQATPPGSKAVKWVKRLQPLVGQDSIDLDNVVDGELTSFVSTPQATVTSVNGMTGDVLVSGGGSDTPIDLSEYATKVKLDAAVAERAWDRGVLPDGTDFNAVRKQGVYTVSTSASAATMVNVPTARPGILRVETNDGASMTIQSFETYVSSSDEPGRFIRSSLSSSSTAWSPWTSKKWVNGVLPNGTSLQGFRVPGAWMVPSTTAAATMVDLPVNSPGVLEVIATRDTSRSMQRFTVETSGSLEVYARTSGTTSSMPSWTKVSGGVQSTTITSASAFIGAEDRLYVVVAGVMRNDGTGWQALDDTIHRHSNVESTTTGPESITINFPTLGAQKVVSFVCTPDETLTKAGYACAASVSLNTAEITLSRFTPMADYVQYNATNGWTSLNGVFRNLTFSNGTLTMEHDPIGGSNFMDFQVTSRGEVLASGSAQAGGSTQTVTKIDFRDYAGALITTASPSLRAYVSRGSSGPVDPSTLTTTRYPASNIWFQGIFEL